MSVPLQDPKKTLSETLSDVVSGIKGETITLRLLMQAIGEQGLLLVCILICLPFLIPVSIPGVSTVFGLGIILIGIAITLNRLPWLPRRVADRQLATKDLVPVLQRGAKFVARFDKAVRPRYLALSGSALMNRFNGLMLIFGGVLLIFPLGLIPFSNTLPAIAIILLGIGMLQRDGLFILGGYVFNLLTVIYFGILAIGAIAAGAGIASLLGSG